MADTKGVDSFLESLRELNTTDDASAPAGEGGGQHDAIVAMYDLATDWSLKGELWNWGLHEPEIADEMDRLIPGFSRFDTDTFSEQLYLLVLRELPIDYAAYGTLRVLEVGSGMGAGLNFLSRIIRPERLIGLDLSAAAVDRANSTLGRPAQLEFVQGDAEKLPFDDGEFDVVLNVESAHNYPHLDRFIAEVTRVLKPGGFFSQVDIFTPSRLAEFDRLKAEVTGLEWLRERDISDGVRESIRRRMRPGSIARAQFAEKRKKLPARVRRMGGPGGVRMFGADFAGYQPSRLTQAVNQVISRRAEAQPGLAQGSYRLNVARKR